ncbi:hypothetical protein DOTSEDRAFT_89249 [Dothistroma septosporum NZE10]|uniref:Uncharacterized protein n=1 Tax=Dothistroma septosporum (strain NZE10 / CBS 128990) TaxID=675120 RepID=M2YN29_DOTSN|nr:hypothetical protein DOTSEDRAFT_89249 [Dothistroma septosporum NZE10]
MKFFPAYVVLVAIFIAVYYNHFTDASIDLSSFETCTASFNYSFRINAAMTQAHSHSSRSWEIAYAYEATQQMYNPERSVFGPDPFPNGKVPMLGLRLDEASLYVEPKLKTDRGASFDEDNGAVSDPASLGVAAVQLSHKLYRKKYAQAAARRKDYLLNQAPRYSNGAVSHREDQAELWSDAIATVPPFLAYYGVATNDLDLVQEAVRQIGLYRNVLLLGSGPQQGLWRHIAGPLDFIDHGAWSTGNAWAAYGMARVRATIAAWSRSKENMTMELNDLDMWIAEILGGAARTDNDSSGLLRNYLGDTSWSGETSGTSLLAATAYRMAVMRPDVFAKPMLLDWAHRKRRAVIKRIDDNGIARPAQNPLQHNSKIPFTGISGEGESFLLLLGTAWRDCVCTGTGDCLATCNTET